MLKIVTNTLYPVVIMLVAPLGIDAATPFGEAVTILLLAGGSFIIGWWINKTNRQD